MNGEDGSTDNSLPLVSHDIALEPGTEITLSLADSNILSDNANVILEDARLNDLARFRKQTKERERIKEYKDRVGETGISTAVLGDDDDDDDHAENSVKPLTSAVISKDSPYLAAEGERMAGDEERIQPTTAWVPVASTSAFKDESSKGFKKRRIQEPDTKTDWDAVFNHSDPINSIPASEPAAFARPQTWRSRSKDLDDNEEEVLQTLDLIKKIRDENSNKLQIIVKECFGDPSPDPSFDTEDTLIMSRTEEFAKTLPSPLEILKEQQQAPIAGNELQRKGVIFVTANSTNTTHVSGVPSLVKGVEEIFDDTSLDGGLAGALHYLKAGGAMNEERWKLGRHGGEEKRPITELSRTEGDEDPKSIDSKLRFDYLDAWGNVMNAKDAFRQMSYKFHGKGPGKKKTEKLLKRMVLDKKLRSPEAVTEDSGRSAGRIKVDQGTLSKKG